MAALVSQIHRHSASTVDVDAQALSDADLATLACEPQKYAAYRKNIRAEYAHIPVEDYLEARLAILNKLVARSRIFCSPMAAMWEEPARENITAELARLTAELEEYEATAVDPDAAEVGSSAAGTTPRRELSPEGPDDADSSSTLGRAPRFGSRS